MDPFDSAPKIARTPPRIKAAGFRLTSPPCFAEAGCQTDVDDREAGDVISEPTPTNCRNNILGSLLPHVIKAVVVNLLMLPWLPPQATDGVLAALSPAIAFDAGAVGAGGTPQVQDDCRFDLTSCVSMLSELRLSCVEPRETELLTLRPEPPTPSWPSAANCSSLDMDQAWEMPGSWSTMVPPALEGDVVVIRRGATSGHQVVQVPADATPEPDMRMPKHAPATPQPNTLLAHGLLSPGNAVLATAGAVLGFRGIAR